MGQGASAIGGMHVSTVHRLRQALGLDKPGTPVKVVEPYIFSSNGGFVFKTIHGIRLKPRL